SGPGVYRCYCAAWPLAVVVELHLPAPLAAVSGVPPRLEPTDLTAGQDHRVTDVVGVWPTVLTRHLISATGQAGHRKALAATRQRLAASDDGIIPFADG